MNVEAGTNSPLEHELRAAFLTEVSERLGPIASSGSLEVTDEQGVTHQRFFALIEPEFPEF